MGHCMLERGGNGYPVKAKQPLGGVVMIVRHTGHCNVWPNIPGITELGSILTVVSDPARRHEPWPHFFMRMPDGRTVVVCRARSPRK
jgi:hypothetical protein